MVTVKKDTIQTKKFESEIIRAIKTVEKMDIPLESRMKVLDLLRAVHNECLEWGVPVENFKTFEAKRVEYLAEEVERRLP